VHAKILFTASKAGDAISTLETRDLAATYATVVNCVHDAIGKPESRIVAGFKISVAIDMDSRVSLKIHSYEVHLTSIGEEDRWMSKAVRTRTGKRIQGDMEDAQERTGDISCVSCATIGCVRYAALEDISIQIGGRCIISIDREEGILDADSVSSRTLN
jgi:hypothetical protein